MNRGSVAVGWCQSTPSRWLRVHGPEQRQRLAQWRPLDDALAVLWQAGAWRQELRQLLELLAARADHRLHPLPWA
ncbi:MAG: hypothetical protein ACKOPS_12720, partial [Cyanobium sp.]